jgi:hypothetical protein
MGFRVNDRGELTVDTVVIMRLLYTTRNRDVTSAFV